MKPFHMVFFFLFDCLFMPHAISGELPSCLKCGLDEPIEYCIQKNDTHEDELLARLVYAESKSTGFADDVRVYQAIAWGVMNRVRLASVSERMERVYGKGVAGVIFKKGQFNPAISRRSKFSKDFLCPDQVNFWKMALSAAGMAIHGVRNPFIQTPWEKVHGLSLVVNFYYPGSIQARGPYAPWENEKRLLFIGDVPMEAGMLSADRVRFYRLSQPPTLDHDR